MNKPRLIDANELLDKIPYPWDADDALYYEKVIKAIADQPTAYDTDKVVEELEELKQSSIRNECVMHGKCPNHCNAHYVSRAIEIVKGNCCKNGNSSKCVGDAIKIVKGRCV